HCHAFFFASRRRHTRSKRDWSSDVCSSDLARTAGPRERERVGDRLVECHAESLGKCGHGDPQSAQSLLEAFVVVGAEERLAAARSEERRVGKEGRCRWGRVQWSERRVAGGG